VSHEYWHWCLTVGDDTGEKVPLKLKEGKRGNSCGLFRFPHGWTEEQKKAATDLANSKVMELADIFRQPQESLVFNPIQGQPTLLPDDNDD
jgi:hypothetical protein